MAGSTVFAKIICTALITVFFILNINFAQRLNVPRVLLPIFNDFPVNFTLTLSDGGCYKWSTTRLDIIRLVPIDEDYDKECSSAIIIQTVTREPVRNTAIVLAEDINNGEFLRCAVITDAIFSLNVVTTTKELYIEEAPEIFEVRAYDDQGNEFSTLEGIEFMWSIGNTDKYVSQLDNKPNDVLKFMTFQESQYETPPTVVALDAIGKQGHIVLLGGERTGTAKVSVKLPHSEYKHVSPIEVELIIIANLIIIPSDVTMMPYDGLRYKIMQVHEGRLEEINLPFSQYYLEAENPNLLQIDNDHAFAYALAAGRTKVFLHDKNVREEYAVILPSATVHINNVASISLNVLPNRNFALILEHTHEIMVELFDHKDHKLYIGEGIEVSMKINDYYFQPNMISQNGTYVIGTPIRSGTMIVEAAFYGIIDKYGKKVPTSPILTTKAEFSIHTKINIHPKILAIPWHIKSKSRYDIALKANGGESPYIWTSKHPSIIKVLPHGEIRILQAGIAEVVVAMAKNQFNKDTAKIYILPPTRLKIIEYTREAATGELIFMHIGLYGMLFDGSNSKEIPFNDCRNIYFEVYIPDGNFIQVDAGNTDPVGTACAVLAITSQTVGTSEVIIAYNFNDKPLTDNVTVSAYEPLVSLHPESAETVLAVGTSRKIVFKGGPQAWFSNPQSYSQKIHISNEEIVGVVKHDYLSAKLLDTSVFEVICTTLGETILTYSVSNIPVLPNCKSTYAIAKVKIICGKPRYINLQPLFKDSKNCPISKSANKIMARSDKNLKVLVAVKDDIGRQFDNITSLNIEWNLMPASIGFVEIPIGSIEEPLIYNEILLPNIQFQNVNFKKRAGTAILTATVTGYQKNILEKMMIVPEWPPFPVEVEKETYRTPIIDAALEINLVNETKLTPSKLTILNDSRLKYYLHVNQGSGYYDLLLSSEDIAEIRYVEPMKAISITPKKSGLLRIALLDLCFSSKAAEADIEVQQLFALALVTVDKVEKGKCITAALKLFDTSGSLIKLPALTTLDFKVEIDNKNVETEQLPPNEQGTAPYEQILYKIKGIEEGDSQLIFINMVDDQKIESDPVTIQVFTPMSVYPKNLTALIGTVYQVTIIGGPTNSEIEFSIEDESILNVDQNGIFEGKSVGHTKIFARAIGFNAKGYKVIYSEDFAEIHVVYLEGVKIVVPTNKVKVGAKFPLWAFGVPECLTPLIIGSIQLPLSFAWSSSDTNLLTLYNMYDGTGINIRYQNGVSLRARAINPGLVTVFLNITIPHILSGLKSDETYTTFVKIEIFEELHLINPPSAISLPLILMSPHSILKLQTNKDKYSSIVYKILSISINDYENSNNYQNASKLLTLDKSGTVKTGENLGRAIISITYAESYHLKQILTVVIEIKPVHYMMLYLKSNIRLRLGEELNMLPNGMELDYGIDYYDNIGRKFDASKYHLKATCNRADLASFNVNTDNLINVKFVENGEIVVKVSTEKSLIGMFDYTHMMIGDVLFPTKSTLTIGDVVCFSMPLLSPDGDTGYWQSSVPEVLVIDPVAGIGIAKSAGSTVVKHNLAAHIQDEIEIIVEPIAKVSIVHLKGKNITGSETFSVPLVLKSVDEEVKENNVLARGLGGCRTQASFKLNSFPYICNIEFLTSNSIVGIKDLFLVKPRFDIITGFYYCDIIPVGAPSITSSTLEARIIISAQSRDIEATPMEINYLPPVFVNAKEIVFVDSPTQTPPITALEIYGLQIALDHLIFLMPDGLVISEQQRTSKYMVHYKIRLMQNQDEIQGQKIGIINDLTKQNISLVIRVSKYETFVSLSGIQWVDYIYFYRYTFVTFLVLVITFFYVWRNKVSNIELTIKNKTIFADTSPPPLKKSSTPCRPSFNDTSISPSPPSPSIQLKPFSAFQLVYGDPRGFYTPNSRRNRSLNCSDAINLE
ncbi:nuclear pore membrane glycoprotein 210 [Prorops nasuta]|uniref:nuclear pore membrane glycoprotein 210 n=1 Tax=Prorops nasuta TaxID=863751 RepID=UPI0034CE9393